MRLPGYCTECKKIKQVRVSGQALALFAAGNKRGVVTGICWECEEKR